MDLIKKNRFKVEPSNLLGYITLVVLLTMYMFYIDEGYFSFAWMSEPGAWFVFSLYSVFFLVILLCIDAFTFRKLTGMQKGLATVGCFIVFLFIFLFAFALR